MIIKEEIRELKRLTNTLVKKNEDLEKAYCILYDISNTFTDEDLDNPHSIASKICDVLKLISG